MRLSSKAQLERDGSVLLSEWRNGVYRDAVAKCKMHWLWRSSARPHHTQSSARFLDLSFFVVKEYVFSLSGRARNRGWHLQKLFLRKRVPRHPRHENRSLEVVYFVDADTNR